MRASLILLVVLLSFSGFAQEDDYFQSQETRKQRVRASKLAKEAFPHHEKLSLHVFSNASFSQVIDVYGLFNEVTGGFGGDVGLGLRIRVFKKLAVTVGGTYSNKVSQFKYNVLFANGLLGEAEIRMRTEYVGFYGKVMLDISRKFWLSLHLEKGFVVAQELITQQVTPQGFPAYTEPELFKLSFPYGLVDQFDVGIHLGMKFPMLYPTSVRPFLGLQVGTSGILRTNEYGPKFPLGQEGEINPSFMHLKLGVIFDIPLLPVRRASKEVD